MVDDCGYMPKEPVVGNISKEVNIIGDVGASNIRPPFRNEGAHTCFLYGFQNEFRKAVGIINYDRTESDIDRWLASI